MICKAFPTLFLVLLAITNNVSYGQEPATSPLRVGLYDNPPKIYRDQQGRPAGFWPALVRELARREGWQIEWVYGNWTELTEKLENHAIDVLPDVARNEQRQRRFTFNHEQGLISWSRVYTRPDSTITTFPDLDGLRIAVLAGSSNYVGENGIESLLENFHVNATFIEKASYDSVFAAVARGEAAAGVTNKHFGNHNEAASGLRRTPIIFAPASLHFAFPPDIGDNNAIMNAIDQQLEQLKADNDSIYYRLLERDLGMEVTEKTVLPDWFLPASAGAAFAIAVLLCGNLLLNYRIRTHTRVLHTESRQRSEAETELANKELLLQAFIHNSPSAIYIKDRESHIKLVNPVFVDMAGRPENELIGLSYLDLFPAEQAERFRQNDLSIMKTGSSGTFEEALTLNNETRTYLSTKFPLRDWSGEILGVCGISMDISSQIERQKEIDFLAHHDVLTRLPNRHRLEQLLKACIDEAAREDAGFSLAFIDIDHFKSINDSLGHAAGDTLLREIAARLRAALRTDDFIARVGGDEFVVLLRGIHDSEGLKLALSKLLSVFDKPIHLNDRVFYLSVSVGVAIYPEDGNSADTLLSNADAAMYESKSLGRNRMTRYYPALTDILKERFELEAAMRASLANGDFFLLYQPQIDLGSGTLAGLEALIRWQRPGQGAVSPGDFIPVAEACGLIVELDAWVLNEACRQARAWLDEGVEFTRVSVNISAQELTGGDFRERIMSAIQRHGIPGEVLGIEVTESMLMENIAEVYEDLRFLSNQGVFISIDDFGTGYSSLSYLKRLQVDELKIDKSFIDDVPQLDYDRAICETIIQMGRHLELEVIAEGVETEEQVEYLHQQGCQRAQGYWYARPLKPDELHQWFRRSA